MKCDGGRWSCFAGVHAANCNGERIRSDLELASTFIGEMNHPRQLSAGGQLVDGRLPVHLSGIEYRGGKVRMMRRIREVLGFEAEAAVFDAGAADGLDGAV